MLTGTLRPAGLGCNVLEQPATESPATGLTSDGSEWPDFDIADAIGAPSSAMHVVMPRWMLRVAKF